MTSPPAWVVERNIFNLLAEADRKLDLLELEIYYRERHNYEIPFQHYGYDSLDAFLRTLKDTCEVMEHRWGIEVRLFKRRSQIRDLSEPSKEQEVKVPYLDKPITFPVRYSLLTADNLKKMQKAKDRVEQIKKTEEEKKLLESQSCLTAYAAQTEISTDDKCDENAQVSTEVGRNTGKANKHPKNTPTQTVSTQMPASVKMNLKKLMWLHPEGVWCRELQRLYKEDLGLELNPISYRYQSVRDMCADAEDIFHVLRPGVCDWLLFGKTRPVPPYVHEMLPHMSEVLLQTREELVRHHRHFLREEIKSLRARPWREFDGKSELNKERHDKFALTILEQNMKRNIERLRTMLRERNLLTSNMDDLYTLDNKLDILVGRLQCDMRLTE